ncbi:hypothetical protein [Microscilla marina]|uniref:Uncharacterized protein n=1 Tax=Microscilla marina ATCC 23134 TaxID=313606 RepID=A1ZSP2_MICM2|nr:hypothetical protein [Microscilla marina]EAY26622.1 hypothetical protein M23134_06151 [Microscilla marina ATCC 23134]
MKTLFIFLILLFPGLDPPPAPSDTSRPEAQAETGRHVLQKIEKQARKKIPPPEYRNIHKKPALQVKSPYQTKDEEDVGIAIALLLLAVFATGLLLMIRFNVAFWIAALVNLGVHLLLMLWVFLGIGTEKNKKPVKARNLAGALGAAAINVASGCAGAVLGYVVVGFLIVILGITTLFLYFESSIAFLIIGGLALLGGLIALFSHWFTNDSSTTTSSKKEE